MLLKVSILLSHLWESIPVCRVPLDCHNLRKRLHIKPNICIYHTSIPNTKCIVSRELFQHKLKTAERCLKNLSERFEAGSRPFYRPTAKSFFLRPASPYDIKRAASVILTAPAVGKRRAVLCLSFS